MQDCGLLRANNQGKGYIFSILAAVTVNANVVVTEENQLTLDWWVDPPIYGQGDRH